MNDKAKNKKKKNPFSGIVLAFTFLIAALILFFMPGYFKYILASKIVMYVFTFIGIIGFSVEFDRNNKTGTSNLGLGISLGLIWTIIYYYFPIWWVNIITFPILFFSIYGILVGLVNIINTTKISEISLRNKLIIKFLGQVFAIVLVVLQILKIFDVL